MFSPKPNALALGLALAIFSGAAMANIQSQMDSMFEGMSNSTAPGAFETATRGVISGGSMRIRNEISTGPVVSFRPPSIQAGCGGIDMFAGSFSFINAQQFVQTLRSVASNAVGVASGYAFKLALQAMGPTPANVISQLQETMQKMNEMMSNSCQLATGLVTDTFLAFGANLDNNDKQKSLAAGLGDAFSSFNGPSNDGGKSAGEKVEESGKAEACKDFGNVLWCAMVDRSTKSFFKYGSDQTEELIMSMTGSYILGEMDEASDGKGKTRRNVPLPPLEEVSLITLIEGKKGEKLKVYDCSDDENTCVDYKTQEIEFDGLASKIEKAFIGSGSSPGIIYKWSTNTGSFTPDEIQVISALQKSSFSAMIQRLSQRSASVASGFVSENSKLIARDAMHSLARSYLDAAGASLVGSPMISALGEHPDEFLNRAYTTLNTHYAAALEKYGSNAAMMADYNNKMQIMPAPGFLSYIGEKPVAGAE